MKCVHIDVCDVCLHDEPMQIDGFFFSFLLFSCRCQNILYGTANEKQWQTEWNKKIHLRFLFSFFFQICKQKQIKITYAHATNQPKGKMNISYLAIDLFYDETMHTDRNTTAQTETREINWKSTKKKEPEKESQTLHKTKKRIEFNAEANTFPLETFLLLILFCIRFPAGISDQCIKPL